MDKQSKEAMSVALTQFAEAKCPRPFRHTIIVTSLTRGGDIHLNGKMVVRVHPDVIMSGITLTVLVERVFEVINEKDQALIKLRRRSIAEAQVTTTSNLQYLMRAMSFDEFDEYIRGVVGHAY